MDIYSLLMSFGLGIASSAAYDQLLATFAPGRRVTRAEAEAAVGAFLHYPPGSKLTASTVIDIFVRHGVLNMAGTELYAPQAITIGANAGQFRFGDGSVSRTDKTEVATAPGSFVHGQNAGWQQNADGSIKVTVGSSGTAVFHTGGHGYTVVSSGPNAMTVISNGGPGTGMGIGSGGSGYVNFKSK